MMARMERDDTNRKVENKYCRLCSGSAIQDFLIVERSPSSVEGLLDAAELGDDEIITLNVVRCDDCGFIHLPYSPLKPDFYRGYDKSAIHSEKMRVYQEELAAELNNKFQLSGLSILETGCGDGNFSALLAKFGANIKAVEPGIKAAKMAKLRGISVIEDYFHPDLPLDTNKFDIIVMRQVLSHIEDLNTFLSATDKFLKPGGTVIVEVPNVNKAIAKKHYFDFFADYVNYFSSKSLNHLMESRDFELQECSLRMDDDYILGVFQKQFPIDFMADFANFSTSLKDIINSERKQGRRVACWGAGGRGVSLLVMCGFDKGDIAYVVDSSPEKQGLFTPGSKFQIVAPKALLNDPVDSIMITAILFQEEILNSLKNEFGFSGKVILLAPHPRTITI